MTILVMGAMGFIGSEVVRQRAAAGQQTRVMVRRPSGAPLLAAAHQRWSGSAPVADDEAVTWNDFFEILTTFAPETRVVRVPRRLATGVAGTVLGRRGPTMVSADTIRGWNLSLWLTSRRLWSELDLVPRYRSVLEGIPACLDGYVAFRWRHPVFDHS